jgi:hypothetical protein
VAEEVGKLTGAQVAPEQQPAVMSRLVVTDAGAVRDDEAVCNQQLMYVYTPRG